MNAQGAGGSLLLPSFTGKPDGLVFISGEKGTQAEAVLVMLQSALS